MSLKFNEQNIVTFSCPSSSSTLPSNYVQQNVNLYFIPEGYDFPLKQLSYSYKFSDFIGRFFSISLINFLALTATNDVLILVVVRARKFIKLIKRISQ
ncbi:10448_t:CDS:2 [Dentiscutata erythropus]|uniref:10448_t:CDS:1 n=1 Tax=Dentiscutata erythropus TaxID=1348616 RepID=A0A9N9NSR3_9GLOM|nr:10448_t:CDS:2 [Dentiscutata erythropus]